MTTYSKQPRSQGRRPVSQNALPEPLEAYLQEAAKGAAGKPLSESLTPDSPLKKLIGRFVEVALEEEMRQHLGYDHHERRPSGSSSGATPRKNTRNGYSKKRLKTSYGQTHVQVPRDRQASFEPVVVPKYASVTEEVEARTLAMYAQGMTTREIQRHVEELYGFQASEMFVSRLTERLDPELAAWRARPLEATYAVVFIDAMHLKVRHAAAGAAAGVHSTAAYTVTGYGENGTHEILGLYMAPEGTSPSESASFWHQVLVELEKRGLEQILILCADGLTGLEEAAGAVYPQARFQPCLVHLMRTSLRHVAYTERKAVARQLKHVYQAPTYESAEQALDRFALAHRDRYPAVVRLWQEKLPALAALFSYSEPLRKLVYTTNPIEGVHRQVRKVTKNRGVLPNVASAMRLLTLVLRDLDQRQRKRARPDWRRIVAELHIHFTGRLPQDWGRRL